MLVEESNLACVQHGQIYYLATFSSLIKRDHCNMLQTSNEQFPPALRVLQASKLALLPAVLIDVLNEK